MGAGRIGEDEEAVTRGGISGDQIPDSIRDVADSIIVQAMICEKTGRRFNIAPQELVFYKEHQIPLPRHHFDYRTTERLLPLAVLAPLSGTCFFCGKSTTHYCPPELGYKKIACEICYQSEVT